MINNLENLTSRKKQLIQWINNQEEKLADEHWFDSDTSGTSRRKMEMDVENMYIELNDVRNEITNLENKK